MPIAASSAWLTAVVNQSEGALPDIERAIAADPNDGIGYYRRARVLNAQGKLDRAAKDYERAVELEPGDSQSHLDFGVLLYTVHDFERALTEFDTGTRLVQDDPLPLAWRAQANLALKRLDAAAADNRRATRLGIAAADIGHAFQRVAENLRDQNDFAGAAREFKIAMAFEPDDYVAIGLYSARVRANPADEPAARAALASWAKPHQPHAWTDTLVSMLLSRTTLEAALAEADAADTYALKAGYRCEADYYAAEQLLGHEQETVAKRLLEEAYWVCPSSYVEGRSVAAERRLIEAKPSAK